MDTLRNSYLGDLGRSTLALLFSLALSQGAAGQDTVGDFAIPVTILTGVQPARSIGIGDANHDGQADIAVLHVEADTMWILYGDGSKGFSVPTVLPVASRQKVVAVGDINGDGINDQAVVEEFAAGTRLRFGDGAGRFHEAASSGKLESGVMLVADLNADGNRDLAVIDGRADYVSVTLGNKEGDYGAMTSVWVGITPSTMATGDFNRDGVADLVVAGDNVESVVILLGDGNGGFKLARDFPVGGLKPSSLAVGDLNGDGMADVAVADRWADNLSVLYGDGMGGFGAPTAILDGLDAGVKVAGDSRRESGNENPNLSNSSRSAASATGRQLNIYEGVASLTLNPTTINGGSGGISIGTVTLNAPAPAGGVIVTLTSTNVGLAASMPSITVPAGATTATFTVGTNANYRRYSGLAFSVTISATHAATVGATLNVTAQPRPADFPTAEPAGSTQPLGVLCGGINIAGEMGILYECTVPNVGFGLCVFRQECNIGCRTNGSGADFCASTGPNPIAVSRNLITSGDRVPSSVVAEAPAAATTPPTMLGHPLINFSSNASIPSTLGGLVFPGGTSSVGFDVGTSYVPKIEFFSVAGYWFRGTSDGRAGSAWIAMVPPNPPPIQPIPTPIDFKITGINPVTGGQSSSGTIFLSGIPHGIGPTITFTSSNPAIVPAPASITPAASNILGFDVLIVTRAAAADTDVTLTATDGRYTLSAILRVLGTAPPPVLAALTVNPTSVVGGNPSTATISLTAARSVATNVIVDIIDSAPATLPTNGTSCPPSSRCHIVTIPANATSASFVIATSTVTGQFNLNINSRVVGATSPGPQALLLITLGATPTTTLSAMALNPSSVMGSNNSTGTVTLSAAAPSGGVVVTLSDDSVSVNVPASVTIVAGATSANFTVTTSTVITSTSATISAVFAGVTRTAVLSISPATAPVPVAPTLISPNNRATPAQPVTFDWNDVANATSYEIQIDDSSIIAAPFITNQTVNVSQVSIGGLPAQQLWWRVRAQNSAGVFGSFSSTRRFTPQAVLATASLSAVTVNPTSATGGTTSQGTVTLTSAAPAGGTLVSLSDNSTAASVPASVTVLAGANSASFTVTTTAVVASTSATISAALAGVIRTAVLTVSPAATGVSLTVTASGRSGEQVVSSPAGINVAVGSTQSASFATSSSITLSVSNGRDAIWSGACSSGGNKTKTCTFTITGNAAVTGNVQ